MYLVIEGCSGIGKTSIAKYISENYQLEYFHFPTTSTDIDKHRNKNIRDLLNPYWGDLYHASNYDHEKRIYSKLDMMTNIDILKININISIIDNFVYNHAINYHDDSLIEKINNMINPLYVILYSDNINEILNRSHVCNPITREKITASNNKYKTIPSVKKICVDDKTIEEITNEILQYYLTYTS